MTVAKKKLVFLTQKIFHTIDLRVTLLARVSLSHETGAREKSEKTRTNKSFYLGNDRRLMCLLPT